MRAAGASAKSYFGWSSRARVCARVKVVFAPSSLHWGPAARTRAGGVGWHPPRRRGLELQRDHAFSSIGDRRNHGVSMLPLPEFPSRVAKSDLGRTFKRGGECEVRTGALGSGSRFRVAGRGNRSGRQSRLGRRAGRLDLVRLRPAILGPTRTAYLELPGGSERFKLIW